MSSIPCSSSTATPRSTAFSAGCPRPGTGIINYEAHELFLFNGPSAD